MAHIENTTQNRKNKHLSTFEHDKIAALHKASYSNQEIGRQHRPIHQIAVNELKREAITQIKTDKVPCTAYYLKIGQDVYKQNRENCDARIKLLVPIFLLIMLVN